jgi:hypothetical protein
MRYLIFIFSILLFSVRVFSQADSIAFVQLQQKIEQLQTELKNQRDNFSKHIQTVNDNISILHSEVETEKARVDVLTDSLNVKISETAQIVETQIAGVNKSVGNKTIAGIIGGIILLLLSVALFVWLYCKLKNNRTDIIQLEKQKTGIEEKLVKEFSQQTELMESLLKTIREMPVTTTEGEPDHSLALKLADEITLMERNISHMNQDTKGLKPLIRAIERLKANLNSNGYELVELVGKQYNEGMKITIVSSIPDENVRKGVDIITKVIKPQVNYRDKMIQMAQVEVTVGVNE